MGSLRNDLTSIMADAFKQSGMDASFGEVTVSSRPDLGQFQCNGALAAGRVMGANPKEIAERVVSAIHPRDIFREITLAGPGFINLTLTDDFLGNHIQNLSEDTRYGYDPAEEPLRILVDYGGPNVAKPLHVGHLRAAIIGESVKRIAAFSGHRVIGDIHLGDWGLQIGMIIVEMQRRSPDLPYFDATYDGPYPGDPPFTLDDLDEIYPKINEQAKNNTATMEAAKNATFELQQGRSGYRALWRHIWNVSVNDLKESYAKLNVHFDLWLGESDTQDRIPRLIARLKKEGFACESQGALVVDVSTPEDKRPIPPLMLIKSDGAVLYGTTDLATIDQRVQEYNPDLILYVVDNRQSDHFHQVFTAAYKTGIAPSWVILEHDGFGTMNGKDGKPFKTRAGGVMKLKDLIQMVTGKALERIDEIESVRSYSEEEKQEIARIVGVATLKFADLMNHRTRDYVFDLDRFSSFEGKTGPYLLYTAVRIKSILRRAEEREIAPGVILAPESDVERDLMLKLTEFPDMARLSFEARAPNHLCEYAYQLATLANRLYHERHILSETDENRRGGLLGLSLLTLRMLEQSLHLLGIQTPKRM